MDDTGRLISRRHIAAANGNAARLTPI